jgi:hypothetical protein
MIIINKTIITDKTKSAARYRRYEIYILFRNYKVFYFYENMNIENSYECCRCVPYSLGLNNKMPYCEHKFLRIK